MRFKHVIQDKDSCGAACIAIVAGITLAEAKRNCFVRPRKSYVMEWRHLKIGLARSGLKSSRAKRAASFSSIEALSIVCLYGPATADWDHFVVYDPLEKLVYDPLQRDGPRSVDRIKRGVMSYMAVGE